MSRKAQDEQFCLDSNLLKDEEIVYSHITYEVNPYSILGEDFPDQNGLCLKNFHSLGSLKGEYEGLHRKIHPEVLEKKGKNYVQI